VLKTIFRRIMGDQAKPVGRFASRSGNWRGWNTQPDVCGAHRRRSAGVRARMTAAQTLNGRFGPAAG